MGKQTQLDSAHSNYLKSQNESGEYLLMKES